MIGNTPEYFQADNLILQIMDIINGNSLFDELKPLQEADIVNLALDILRMIIQIHNDEDRDEANGRKQTVRDISESPNSFVRFADISIDCQRTFNDELKEILHAFGTVSDVEGLIEKI